MGNDAFEKNRRFAEQMRDNAQRMRENAQRDAEQSRRTREMWEQNRRRQRDRDEADRRMAENWDTLQKHTRQNQASQSGGSFVGGIVVVAAILFILYVASQMGYHW